MLIVNRNAFYEEKEYGSAYSGQSEKEISLNGTQEICQEFVAKEKEITCSISRPGNRKMVLELL